MKRRFFYDTDFMEEPGFLQLISIGVVDEGGNEFYACNWDAHLHEANDWVKENVIPQLPDMPSSDDFYNDKYEGSWKTEVEIREALIEFLRPSNEDPVELWGYYSAYDHVLLCWLFGRMIDLPDGMPMFTKDLRQVQEHLSVASLPEQVSDEHNALEDAKWNRETFKYLRERAHGKRMFDIPIMRDLLRG